MATNLLDIALQKVKQTAISLGKKVVEQTPFADPTSNNGNNFWGGYGGEMLANQQKSLQVLNQLPRVELPKPQVNNKIAQTGINIAYGIPESIVNIPRNFTVGVSRTGTELGTALREGRNVNLQNLAGGVAPLAESLFDVGTMGLTNVGKSIAKQGAKTVLEKGVLKSIGEGALKGAGVGATGGLTYGLDVQYGKEFNAKQVLDSVLSGFALGGVVGGGVSALGSLKGLTTRPKELNVQLRDKAGRWTVGEVPVKPKGMPKPQWEFQIEFNKKYNRNPYEPVMPNDLEKALAYETNKRVGFQARDVNLDKNPLQINTPKGIRTKLDQDVAQISKTELEKQLKGEIATRTTATQEVSSPNIIRPKGQLNVERLNVSGEGKKQLKAIESKVQPTVIGNKEVVDAARTAKGNKGAMTDSQMKNLIAQQVKNRQKVVDLTVRFNEAKKSGATEVELGKILLDMSNQAKVARQSGTFAGRLLQAQNIIADQSASPMQKIMALLDNAGVKSEKYLKDAVNVNWDNPTQVVQFYRKYVPPKLGEVLDEIRYTNMLSSPLTHIINTASNALQTAVVAPVEKTISGTLDWGKSALTGSERQYFVKSGIDYAGGYAKALPDALKKAWSVLSGKEVQIKPDMERIPTGVGGPLQAYSTPLRALEAMDQFFKTLVEGGVTAELKAGPKKLGLQEIASRASNESNYRLFRQAFDPDGSLGQGAVLQMFDKWNSAISNLRRLPGGRWVLPFLQTPTNILKQGVEYSPLGAATAVGAKAPIEQLSKAIIGTGVFMGAYQLAKNGLITWESPANETERELYYSAGMQPYSVKVGDNWVSFSKLGPLSYPLAMAAAIASAERNNPDKKTTENLMSGVSGILGFFGDQSYVRSIGDLVDAIQGGVNIGPTALSSEAANLAGQLIPYRSFLTWLGRITDPTYRKATAFVDKLKKDIPIVGSSLEPYTDVNGNPSKRDYPLINAVSPLKITKEKSKEAETVKRYQEGKIQRAVEKRADEAFVGGDRSAKVTGKIFRYVDESGSLRKIDTGKVTNLPNNTEYEKAVREKQAYSLADDILKLPVDEQAAAFATIGISPEDAVYYNTSKQDNRLKTLYVQDEISKLDTKDRGNLINYLVSQRKEVNGNMVLTNGVVDNLFDEGVISDSEKKMLKNLKVTNGKAKTKLTGRGKKTTLKKVSAPPAPTKIKAPKIKSMSTLLKGAKLKVKKYKYRMKL